MGFEGSYLLRATSNKTDHQIKKNLANPRIDRRDVVFRRDNVRPHVSFADINKHLALEYVILPDPPYAPDIAPSD